ncbi:O-antigen ligase family protein [Arenibacter sp. GZD96]|uniref:O-antigen ligase family protein n=1 Tax=Aurantibrevibacter litoralis TaxID=3106030 RepID=UPI002AFF0CF6|nr:O-antigen ligase family protein [Arenibacter sp. GZD-96]MEA1786445.1 O-antigen ligase family protein [Arenibacter sp. GZD-96]
MNGLRQRLRKVFSLVKFSYIVVVINVFLKYVGLGYPMYEHGNIGSKGYFFAGNEISALLIVLVSIIAYNYWLTGKKRAYFLFFVLNLVVGITISSKTGILGILLIFFLIPLRRPSMTISLKRLRSILLSVFLILPVVLIVAWQVVKTSAIYSRLIYFWDRLDVLTFVLSNRNVFLKNAYATYKTEYSMVEKAIGVGQSRYELLNDGKIVEIDVADIFFAYGFIGLFLFVLLIGLLLHRALKLSRHKSYDYARYVLLMTVVLLTISTIAGHVFSSGMAGIYIGLLFSLMYVQKNETPRN